MLSISEVNFIMGCKCVYDVVVKSSRSLSHLLMSFLFCISLRVPWYDLHNTYIVIVIVHFVNDLLLLISAREPKAALTCEIKLK